MHKDLQEILVSSAELEAGVKKLGERISRDYAGRCVTLVGVLKGCVLFMSDLAKNITLDTRMDFMMLSSYSGTHSTGVVRILLDRELRRRFAEAGVRRAAALDMAAQARELIDTLAPLLPTPELVERAA